MPVVSIPDLNNMIAVIDLNEVDRPFIHEGDSAELIVEAYPDTVFTGRVVFVSKIVEYLSQSSRAKVYTVHVKINSRENYRLKPGLSAMVKLYLDNVGQVFRVPSRCLFSRENAFFLTTDRAQEIPIELIRLADGNAFVIGKIDDKMKFAPNQHTPTF